MATIRVKTSNNHERQNRNEYGFIMSDAHTRTPRTLYPPIPFQSATGVYRDKLDTLYSVLDVVEHEASNALSHLSFRCALSYQVLKYYIQFAMKRLLIDWNTIYDERLSGGVTLRRKGYHVTRRGHEFMSLYEDMRKIMPQYILKVQRT